MSFITKGGHYYGQLLHTHFNTLCYYPKVQITVNFSRARKDAPGERPEHRTMMLHLSKNSDNALEIYQNYRDLNRLYNWIDQVLDRKHPDALILDSSKGFLYTIEAFGLTRRGCVCLQIKYGDNRHPSSIFNRTFFNVSLEYLLEQLEGVEVDGDQPGDPEKAFANLDKAMDQIRAQNKRNP